MPGSIQRERLLRHQLERCAGSLGRGRISTKECLRRPELQIERWITRRTNLSACPVSVETRRKFPAPRVRISFGAHFSRSCVQVSGSVRPPAQRKPWRGRFHVLSVRPWRSRHSRRGLRMATANFTTQRAIHETLGKPEDRIQTIRAPRTAGNTSTGILALSATLPGR